MLEKLYTLSSHIKEHKNSLSKVSDEIRSTLKIPDDEAVIEKQLTFSLSKLRVNNSVCAVDSGFIDQHMHGVDIVMVKSVAVNFIYENSKLIAHSYLPSRFPNIVLEFKTGLDDHEANLFKSLVRLKYELTTAIDSIIKFNPKVLLIDGSLLPIPSDKPNKESELYSLYLEVIEIYKKLFSLCSEKEILLFGVIKDTRSKKFVDLYNVNGTNDTMFLDTLLKKGERTFTMKYSTTLTPALKDLEGASEKVCVFYIKCNSQEFPLRIEYYNAKQVNEQTDLSDITNTIYSICAINPDYAYPPPLIEADLCAAILPEEADKLASIHSLSGEVLRPLRRDSRLFR
ncbi:MAG: DNA double-strand break repair nuclease NurA [Candidatus Micrarchaeota archaeon]